MLKRLFQTLPAIMLPILLTPHSASAQSAEPWKGDLTGVWQGPYTPDLTRGTQAMMTPWGQEQFNLFDGKKWTPACLSA